MRRFAILLSLAAAGCSDDPLPIEELFDGNVIIGDARPLDARPRDAEAGSEETGTDLEPEDVFDPDAGDAGPGDGDTGADASDAGPICGAPAVATISATSAAQRADLDGLRVDLTGTATLTALRCTGISCPPDMPCCNTCTASIAVDGLVELLPGPCFERAGCEGDECSQVCAPPILDVPQTFRGVLHHRPSRPALTLERVLP